MEFNIKNISELKIIQLDINSLIPYTRNSKEHPEEQIEQIASSIKEFGFTNPVLVDGRGEIIAGHGRVVAAKRLGLKTIPTISLEYLTPEQKKAYVIADNKLAENSIWDMTSLAADMKDLAECGYDLELTGFDLIEIQKIIDMPEELQEKKEALRPLRWTRIMISIPLGAEIEGLNEHLNSMVRQGAQVDFTGN